MSTMPPRGQLEPVTLMSELRARPALLLRELCWRWSCGGVLLSLAGYAGWRIWVRCLPALHATGVFRLSKAGLLADPTQIVVAISSAFAVVWPPVIRACWGLAPLAIFCWVLAFAWGRTWVLGRYDARLPRRVWMHAGTEALWLAHSVLTILLTTWLVESVAALLKNGSFAALALFAVLLAATVPAIAYTGRFRRGIVIGRAIALRHLLPFSSAFRYGWRLDRGERVQVLKKSVRRARWMVLALALVLTFVPAPFGLGWPLLAWWTLLSLPTLVATDAWQLGAMLAVLQTFREPTEVFGDRPAERDDPDAEL